MNRERVVREFDRLHGRHPSDIEIETWLLQELHNEYYGPPEHFADRLVKVDGIWTADAAKKIRELILNMLG